MSRLNASRPNVSNTPKNIPQIMVEKEYQENVAWKNKWAWVTLWVCSALLFVVCVCGAYYAGKHYTIHQLHHGELGVACQK